MKVHEIFVVGYKTPNNGVHPLSVFVELPAAEKFLRMTKLVDDFYKHNLKLFKTFTGQSITKGLIEYDH